MTEQKEMLEYATIWECSRSFWELQLDGGPKTIENWDRKGKEGYYCILDDLVIAFDQQ